jgi:urease accessory protein UreE
VNSFEGKLYRVDPRNGAAVQIDLGGGEVPSGDGLVLRSGTLYVVQNVLNQIAVIKLDRSFTSGEITGHLTNSNFRVPTTAAAFGNALYTVNARFDEVPPGQPDPDDTFEAVRVPIQ